MATGLVLFELPISGGAGTVGYALYNADATVAVARTTSGITETPASSGKYSANPTLPDNFVGFFVADDTHGNYVRGDVIGETEDWDDAFVMFELPLVSGSGTVGYAIYEADASVAIARTTAGISETPAASGKYSATPTIPGGFTGGFFIADDSFGNYVQGHISGVSGSGVDPDVAGVTAAINLLYSLMPVGNDPDRTWVCRRTASRVGSSVTKYKTDDESLTFWFDVERLLAENEVIGDLADIDITASGVTISEIAKAGFMISATFADGTAGEVDVVLEFEGSETGTIVATCQLEITA